MSPMGDRAKKCADETNSELKNSEMALLLKTSTQRLNEIAPNIIDKEVYNKLISIVKESTSQNLSIAEFKSKIEVLGVAGSKVISLALKLL